MSGLIEYEWVRFLIFEKMLATSAILTNFD